MMYHVLIFQFGPSALYYSTIAAETTLKTGQAISIKACLSEDFSIDEADLINIDKTSVSVDIVDYDINWAEQIERGYHIDGVRATIVKWDGESSIDSSSVLFYGTISSPEYGAVGDALSITISRDFTALSSRILLPTMKVSDETWPINVATSITNELEQVTYNEIVTIYSPKQYQGFFYPVIIGYPGYLSNSIQPIPVVPIPISEEHDTIEWTYDDWWYGIGVWLGGGSSSAYVWVTRQDRLEDAVKVPFEPVQDLLGQTVNMVKIPSADPTERFTIAIDPAFGGCIKYGGNDLRGLGDIVDWVFRTYVSAPIDWVRTNAARKLLNTYRIDTYIDDPETVAFDWLTAILDCFDVELVSGAKGLYPKQRKHQLSQEQVKFYLNADGNQVSRTSRIQYSDSDIFNSVDVKWGKYINGITSSGAECWIGQTIAGGINGKIGTNNLDPWVRNAETGPLLSYRDTYVDGDTDISVLQSARAKLSQETYGVRPLSLELETWDKATADSIASYYIENYSLPERIVSYDLDAETFQQIAIGDVVSLTDSEISLSEKLCEVVNISDNQILKTVTFRLSD